MFTLKEFLSKMHVEEIDTYLFTGEALRMKKIKSLKDLKEHIMTCDFWGNTWAITSLEQILNVKIILLSSEAYEADDKDNVVFCGSLNDEKLGDNFSPDHYIIADFSGMHYKLITYKDKKAFKYNELPYDLKKLILIKCMEGQHGPYQHYKTLKLFQHEINKYCCKHFGCRYNDLCCGSVALLSCISPGT